MTYKEQIDSITDEELVYIVDNYISAIAYCRDNEINENNHRFVTMLRAKVKKYDLEWKEKTNPNKLEKNCPVCSTLFTTMSWEEKTTCSHSCANTYFRSGKNHPNYTGEGVNYRLKCLEEREHKCIICGEDKVVEVHHIDKNRNNNALNNLIVLCPTHHQYIHKGLGHLIGL